jgi:hypothetical protein
MSRNSSGNFTLPSGNPVVGGTVINSTWANPTMTDIGTEITSSLDRSGRGGMLAKLANIDGTVAAPAITFTTELGSGIYRIGSNNFGMAVGGVLNTEWGVGLLAIHSADAGATANPIFKNFRNSASPADDDYIGSWLFEGNNDAAERTTFGSIATQIKDVTDATEDGAVVHAVMIAGTLTDVMTLDASGVTVTDLTISGSFSPPSGMVLTLPQINDTSSDHQYVFAVNELVADRTVTLPLLAADDIFVFEAFIQTLTNKTFSLTNNTLTGTLAEFNTAVSDATLVSTTGTETLSAKTLTDPVLNGTLSGTAFLDEDTMFSDSAIAVSSQQSIKAYVDAQVAAGGGTSVGILMFYGAQ